MSRVPPGGGGGMPSVDPEGCGICLRRAQRQSAREAVLLEEERSAGVAVRPRRFAAKVVALARLLAEQEEELGLGDCSSAQLTDLRGLLRVLTTFQSGVEAKVVALGQTAADRRPEQGEAKVGFPCSGDIIVKCLLYLTDERERVLATGVSRAWLAIRGSRRDRSPLWKRVTGVRVVCSEVWSPVHSLTFEYSDGSHRKWGSYDGAGSHTKRFTLKPGDTIVAVEWIHVGSGPRLKKSVAAICFVTASGDRLGDWPSDGAKPRFVLRLPNDAAIHTVITARMGYPYFDILAVSDRDERESSRGLVVR